MKTARRKSSILSTILIGLSITLILLLINGGVVALLIVQELMQEENLSLSAMISLLVAEAIGAGITLTMAQRKILPCILQAVSVFTSLLLYTIATAEGIDTGILYTLFLILGSATTSYLILRKRTKRRKFLH